MARPSKLTDAQWEKIGKRLLAGESTSALAREFGVSKGLISQRFSKRTETVKAAASLIVQTDEMLNKLNVSEQIAAKNLADELKAISSHLASASKYGAMTSSHLMSIAHKQRTQIKDTDGPLDEQSVEVLKGIRALAVTANESSLIARDLLKANKESIDKMNEPASDDNKLLRDIAAIIPN
jgi:hypothetical protein